MISHKSTSITENLSAIILPLLKGKVEQKNQCTIQEICRIIDAILDTNATLIPIDFNDVVTPIQQSHIIDATFSVVETNNTNGVIEILEKLHSCHKQLSPRVIVIKYEINESDVDCVRYLSDNLLQNTEYNIVHAFSINNDLPINQVNLYALIGYSFDLRTNDTKRREYSKKLAYLLRHTDAIDSQGYCSVSEAIDYCGISYDDLKCIVENDDKNRFEVTDYVYGFVRARNGHSGTLHIDPGFIPSIPPAILYHATTEHAIEKIFNEREGLKGMSRQYVQMSENPAVAMDAAQRHKGSASVLLEIQAELAHLEGIIFYKSGNNVWQAESIPFKYLKQA